MSTPSMSPVADGPARNTASWQPKRVSPAIRSRSDRAPSLPRPTPGTKPA
jgi:hypothetical protein